MIAKEFEDYLLPFKKDYLLPVEDLALVMSNHKVSHVVLLLTSNGYSRIPVMSPDKHYMGTISMADILSYQGEHGLSDAQLSELEISLMLNHHIEVLSDQADLTEIFHQLVDFPFLPVVNDAGVFLGIITRKQVLKSVNSLLHNFKQEDTSDSFDG